MGKCERRLIYIAVVHLDTKRWDSIKVLSSSFSVGSQNPSYLPQISRDSCLRLARGVSYNQSPTQHRASHRKITSQLAPNLIHLHPAWRFQQRLHGFQDQFQHSNRTLPTLINHSPAVSPNPSFLKLLTLIVGVCRIVCSTTQ